MIREAKDSTAVRETRPATVTSPLSRSWPAISSFASGDATSTRWRANGSAEARRIAGLLRGGSVYPLLGRAGGSVKRQIVDRGKTAALQRC